jgi:hypothetical protein
MEGLQSAISVAVDDWEKCDIWSIEQVNNYLTRHETTLASFGLFTRGLRIRHILDSDLTSTDFHRTLDGMRGIISMNVAVLRQKMNTFAPYGGLSK